MAKAFKTYDKAKQYIKKYIPKSLFKALINKFHFIETVLAMTINGFPQRGMKFIGATGTNGKTTTVNLIAAILEEDGKKTGINSTAILKVGDKSWDNDLALTTANPFQIFSLLKRMKKEETEWVVMEVASHALVQHRVWGIRFDVAVMTNLTRDHLDYHGTMEEYAKAKGKLFSHFPKIMVLNRDDEWYEFFDKYETQHQMTYGTYKEAKCRITKARLSSKGSLVSLDIDGHKLEFKLSIPGKFNTYNAAAAASTAYEMGVPLANIKKGLESVSEVPGRMQLIDEGQDFAVIIDHAHTPDALENLLKTIRTTLQGRLITIIGADGDRDPGKREPLGKLAAEHAEVAIVTDQEPYTEDPDQVRKAVLKGAESVKHGVVIKEIPDRREAIYQALKYAKKGDVVVVPGLGNQLTRGVKDGKMEWDDRKVVREELKRLTK